MNTKICNTRNRQVLVLCLRVKSNSKTWAENEEKLNTISRSEEQDQKKHINYQNQLIQDSFGEMTKDQ